METNENSAKEITLYQIYSSAKKGIGYLLSKWLKILFACIIAGLCGIVYAWMQKPQYTATVTFAMEDDAGGGGLGAYAGIAAQFGVDLGGGQGGLFAGENLMELMRSESLVNKALFSTASFNGKDELIINYYLKSQPPKEEDKSKPIAFDSTYQFGSDRIKDSIIKNVNRAITPALVVDKVDKKLNIIGVVYRDGDEVFAKNIVLAITNTVINYYVDYRNKKFKQNVSILQHQTDSVRALITGDMSNIAISNDLNVNPLKQTVRVGTQRRQMDVQTNSIVYGELLKQLELAKIMLRRETPLIQVIDRPVLPLVKKKPGKLATGLTLAVVAGFIMAFILLFNNAIQKQKVTKTK